MAKNKVIVISTHLLEEVEVVCSRAIVIAAGKIVADGTPVDLEEQSSFHKAVTICVKDAHGDSCRANLEEVELVSRVDLVEKTNGFTTLMAFPESGQDILDQVNSKLRNNDIEIEEVRVERGRLDEVFRRITTSV